MKTRLIFMVLMALLIFAGVYSSKGDIVNKTKTSHSEVEVIPGRWNRHIYQQGRHRWHRMHRRHAHESMHRHYMRREHRRETRHYKH